MKKSKFITVLPLLALIAACGGGGSSSGGGGTPGGGGTNVNSPPVFTIGTEFSFEEQFILAQTETIVQLAATDADGDALSFSISGGADAGLFIFNAQEGALAFDSPPSFETPLDSDGDNIYEVVVSVSDGTAAATQTLNIEVTNSLEGVIVTRLVDNLNDGVAGTGGALHYVDETNELLVVNAGGRLFRINARTGVTISSVLTNVVPGPDSEVLGMVVDGLDFRGNNVFVLSRSQTILLLSYVNIETGATNTLWAAQPGGPVTASLGLRGNDVLIGVSDGNQPSAAQDQNDIRGNLLIMVGSGDPADASSFTVTPRVAGIGLRSPRLFTSINLAARALFDRGEVFNEYNEADFAISQFNANFEWPARDGEMAREFNGTLAGELISPLVVQDRSGDDVGGWLAGSDSLQGDGWFGLLVISDDLGNIYTFGTVNAEPLENRNLDFRTAGLGDQPIVSMDDGDTDIGNATPIYMLDAEGNVFVVDLQN